MNHSTQLELVRTLCQQAQQAMDYTGQSWRQVMQSKDDLIESMRKIGMPFEHASAEFERMMEFYKEQYEAVMQHLIKMAAELQVLQNQEQRLREL